MPQASAPAHAKINFALAVAPPDESGMHPIASWFAPIALADDVTITTRDDPPERPLVIEWAEGAPMPSEIDWPAEKDLAVRALRALEQRTGDPLHAEIKIAKRIPAGAGLAGGSSNAATTLKLLNQLFELDLTAHDLRETAATLGSDVAFFIDDHDDPSAKPPPAPRAAFVSGLGNRIERLPLAETHLALIVPDFPCPTGAVYEAFDRLEEHHAFDPAAVEALARAGVPDGEQLFNDLAEAAERVEFVLGSIRSRAAQITGAPAHVTGSGSALFIVCENEGSARARAAAASAELTGCAAFATRTVD